MNKDKAIQLLERLQDPEPYEPMLTNDAYDAIQMAIDAFSADGDTISRKAAIDALDEIESEIADGYGYQYAKWREYFAEIPSAQPGRDTPKRVMWTGWKGHRYTRYNCPNCKKPVRNDDVYCHRCGQRLMFPKVSHTPYVEGKKQEVIVRWNDEVTA